MSNVALMPELIQDMVGLVPQEFIPHEWPNVHDMLKPAVERAGGRWNMAALLYALCVGEQQLWVWFGEDGERKAALTTQIIDYPARRFLAFQFLGGKGFDEWSDDMLMTLEQYAYDAGCSGIEAVGRFGFWPFFKKHKYERAYCTYQLDLRMD